MVKKRILHIVLDMEYGGLEKVIYNIIKNNDPNQLEISLCCLDSGGSVLDQIKRMIDVKTFIIERKPGIIDFRALRKLYRIIKENNIDIIHSHSGCLLYSTIIGRLSCVKKLIIQTMED